MSKSLCISHYRSFAKTSIPYQHGCIASVIPSASPVCTCESSCNLDRSPHGAKPLRILPCTVIPWPPGSVAIVMEA